MSRRKDDGHAPREIELKLEIDDAGVKALKALPILVGQNAQPRKQRSTYFDTPKEKLRKAGLALRVRQSGKRFVQTVKGDGRDTGGMFDRAEWEHPIAGADPDLPALHGTPASDCLRRANKNGGLVPIFFTDVKRTAWNIANEGGEIELVLDEGRIDADGKRAPIREVELELKSGPPSFLFAIARELDASTPLRLGVLSKNERGYLLRDGAWNQPAKAAHVILDPHMTAGAAFQTIAAACIRQFRLNEPLFVEHRDGAALHQARVALRRLRSAFSMFASIAADVRRDDIRDGLRWISGMLGDARDIDVFLSTRLEPRGIPDELRAHALAERARVFDVAIDGLGSLRFRVLMLDLAEWLASGEWLGDENGDAEKRDQPVERFAEAVLDRFWRRLKNRGRHLATIEDDQRHEVRIAGKKLRYASEFFASLYTGAKADKRRKKFATGIEQLQTHLGDLNDIVTAQALGRLFPGLPSPEPDRDALLDASEKAHRRLVEIGPFWR